MQFFLERKKYTTYQALSATVHLEEWNRLFRHRKSIKISKRKMDSKVIESRQCTLALWKDFMLYGLNLILNSNLRLALLDKNRSLSLTETKKFKKQNNEEFFIHLLNAWLHLTNSNFATPKVSRRNS